MDLIMILVLAFTSAISVNSAQELSADFKIHRDAEQILKLGFVPEEIDSGGKCDDPNTSPWCPPKGKDVVNFGTPFPQPAETITFKGEQIYRVKLEKQDPSMSKSNVILSCIEGKDVDQEVNAGFAIVNGQAECLDVRESGDAIKCKVNETNMKITFSGACKMQSNFTFFGADTGDATDEIQVQFMPIEGKTSTDDLTTLPDSKATASMETDLTVAGGTGRTNSPESTNETTTTGISTTCNFSASLLAICFLVGSKIKQ